MIDPNSSIRPTPFTQTELAALQALRVRTRTGPRLITDREPALRRFLRRLVGRRAGNDTQEQATGRQGAPTHPALKAANDAWLGRLKAAYEAGYYRTEPATDSQTPFPWQNKSCQHCPFWSLSVCRVFAEYRSAAEHTCEYFDPWNRAAAQALIQQRRENLHHRWWNWFSGQAE